MSATVESLLPANTEPVPRSGPPGAPKFAADHWTCDTQGGLVGGTKVCLGHFPPDTHPVCAEAPESDSGRGALDTQYQGAGVPQDPQGGTEDVAISNEQAFPALRVYAEMYYDAQKARIACDNRALRGGLDPNIYTIQLQAMKAAEHAMGLALCKEYRHICPPGIRTWQKESRGIGEHMLARLLGHIGHPCHSIAHHWEGTGEDRVLVEDGPIERRVSDLWSYCGHGDPNRRKRKGQTPEEAAAGGSPIAKMLVHLMAESCLKAGGPYRERYDERRMDTAISHPEWTKGHSHNDALRIIGKAILKDLWLAAQS